MVVGIDGAFVAATRSRTQRRHFEVVLGRIETPHCNGEVFAAVRDLDDRARDRIRSALRRAGRGPATRLTVLSDGEDAMPRFAAPVRSWRIIGESPAESRFEARHPKLAPLVGRQEEMAFLLERWDRTTSGEGQVVLLSGEAGIGKSRLVAALAEQVAAETHAELRYFCSAYHANSVLHPVIAQLERAAGFVGDDGADTRLDKLEALLSRTAMEVGETLPLLARLLSIDARARYQPPKLPAPALRARTFDALTRLVEAPAAGTPVLVLVEDAHWIDPTTAEWLEALVQRLEDLPVLLAALMSKQMSIARSTRRKALISPAAVNSWLLLKTP
jgi:hypothetical protein